MKSFVVILCLMAVLLFVISFDTFPITGMVTLEEPTPDVIVYELNGTATMTHEELEQFWNENKDNISAVFNPILENGYLREVGNSPQKRFVYIDSEITNAAREISAPGENDFERTLLLFEFASENITYVVCEDWRNTSEVLESGYGDCTDKSILLVSMLNSIGIESYVVYGTQDINDTKHAWVAARIDGTWLEMDPTTPGIFYIYNCLTSDCRFKRYYDPIEGMFNSHTALMVL
jgi:hypothetical protein